MPTDLENIDTAISNWIRWIATESANPKPSYAIDGQSVQWTQAYQYAVEQVAKLRQLKVDLSGPWEHADVMLP